MSLQLLRGLSNAEADAPAPNPVSAQTSFLPFLLPVLASLLSQPHDAATPAARQTAPKSIPPVPSLP